MFQKLAYSAGLICKSLISQNSLICKFFRNPNPNLKKICFINPVICKTLKCESRLWAKKSGNLMYICVQF